MEDFEITVLVLLSSNTDEKDLRDHLSSFEAFVNNIEFFDDPDECVNVLGSIEHDNIFVILGSGRSNLGDILSTFPSICYIYLCESHPFKHMSQVRGVFPDTKQLLNQLKKDIEMIQNSPVHLSISRSGDSNIPHTSIDNLQRERNAFNWAQMSLIIILRVSRPTDNVYRGILDECRGIYKTNKTVIQKINEFERTYKPEEAISWYTRDSFLFRVVNMALRSKNIVIIWKFRFIIQDIYQQLEALHEKQRKESKGKAGNILMC
jgi:hypothetical protein